MKLFTSRFTYVLLLVLLFTVTGSFSQTVTPVSSQTVCNGASISAITFSGSGTAYGWTNTATSIGLGVSGTAGLPAFVATNTGTAPVTATITVVPNITGTPMQFHITVKPSPNGTASPASATLCSGSSHTVVFSSSIPGTTFSWNVQLSSGSVGATWPFSGTSGTMTNTFSGNASFQYTVVPTYNGCSGAVFSSAVTLNSLPTVGTTASSAAVCEGQNVTLNITGTSVTHTWTGGVTSGVPFSPTVTATYTVTGANSAGCTRTATRMITVNPSPTVSVNSGSICAGAVFTMNPSGAVTYTYSNGTNTVSPAAGISSFSVTGTAANGCSAVAVADVTVHALPALSVNSGSICSGNTFVVLPSGASTYTISGGSANVSPLTTSFYSVTGTSSVGCVTSGPVVSTVIVNTTPTISISPSTATVCSGKSLTLAASGANTYTLEPGTLTGTSFTLSPSSSITYTLSGRSLENCPALTKTAQVTVNTTPTLSISPSAITICSGKSATLVPAGAATYTITGGTYTVSPLILTSYSLTGTGANGCAAGNTAVATVSVNLTPTVTASSGTLCSGNTYSMTVNGAASYSVNGAASSNFTFSPATTSTYAVTGASLGCVSASVAATVSVNATPNVSVTNATICSGQSAILVPSGASTYTISGGAFTVNPNATTVYSVAGTAINGCVSSNTALGTVSVNASPTVSVNSATICSGNQAILIPAGADTYTITGGTFTVAPNATSSYSVTGTAVNGCVSGNTAVATVSVNVSPTVAANSGAVCEGAAFVFSLSSVGGAVTYSVNGLAANGGTTHSVIPAMLGSNDFTITGTGANNCVSMPGVITNVTVNANPTLSISSATICSGNTATLTFGGALANGTYTITDGSSSYIPAGASFTTAPASTIIYSLSGTSQEGCLSANPAIATVSVINTPTISVADPTICLGQTATITASGAVTYTINGGTFVNVSGNNFTVSPVQTLSFQLTGEGPGNCPASNTVSTLVHVNPTPIVTAAGGQVCEGSSFTITAGGAATYSVMPGQSMVITPSVTGTYSVTGTSSLGCVSANAATVTVTVNALPDITATAVSSVVCESSSEEVILTAGGAASYSWSTGDNTAMITIPHPTATTVYTVTGTDSFGCTGKNTTTVTVDPCTGIAEAIAGNTILNLYPNPNNGEFVVETEEGGQIIVINTLGEVVYQQAVISDKTVISIKEEAKGIYFVKVISGKYQQTLKIIKH